MSSIRQKPTILDCLQYGAFRIVDGVLRLTPVAFADAFGFLCGRICWHLMKGRRKIVERNCHIAYGIRPSTESMTALSKEIFAVNGANLISGMKLSSVLDEELAKYVTISGLEEVHTHLNRQESGIIFALTHMGNWEIISRLNRLVAPEKRSAAFYRPLNNPLMNSLIKSRRTNTGTELLSNKDGFSKAITHLKKNGVIGILADQSAGGSGVICPFYGRLTSCSPLIEILHKHTGAVIFHLAMYRTSTAKWHISIRSHPKDRPIETREIMHEIEKTHAVSPRDVFWFHNRWKMNAKKPFLITNKRKSETPIAQTKPWHCVIVLSKRKQIRDASLPAMQHLIEQTSHFHFSMLSPEQIFDHSRVDWHISSEADLTYPVFEKMVQKSHAPVDVLLFLAPEEEQFDCTNIETTIVAAGITKHNKFQLTLPALAKDRSPEDMATWNFLIDQLTK